MLEDKHTEFKRDYVDDIKYAIVAFANTDGGNIYIGLNDDGSVIGVDNPDQTVLRIHNMIRDSIRPDVTMFVDSHVEEISQKKVIVVQVYRGTHRPYYIAGKGIRPEGVYVRHGASSAPASETAIINMIKETSGDSYEEAVSLNQQLTFKSAAKYFSKKKIKFNDAQKRTLKIIKDDGTFSNLGFLLSDQCTHSIKLAVFEGSKKSIFKDRKELSGSILDQLGQAAQYIDKFNRTRATFSGLERIDHRDYPPEAVREALINTVVHRDYSMSAPILISLFDDRLEFINLGGLVRGISFNDIMLGVSAFRNPNLANVFYRLKLIEAYGTGILRIKEYYANCEEKEKIEISNNAFKVTLPNTNYLAETHKIAMPAIKSAVNQTLINKKFQAVIDIFKGTDTLKRRDVESALQISQATAVNLLRTMTESGLLRKEGSGRNLCYKLNIPQR